MTTEAKLLRDRDPEARALGGWYVEFKTPTQAACTDYCRSPHAAMVAALALAFRLGVTLRPAKEA
jgi:hypothetical protein